MKKRGRGRRGGEEERREGGRKRREGARASSAAPSASTCIAGARTSAPSPRYDLWWKGTRHVQLVWRDGRDVSTLYGREGGGRGVRPPDLALLHGPHDLDGVAALLRPRKEVHDRVERVQAAPLRLLAHKLHLRPARPAVSTAGRQDAEEASAEPARARAVALHSAVASPPPPSRTKWTRLVPHPVLIGHAASHRQGRGRGVQDLRRLQLLFVAGPRHKLHAPHGAVRLGEAGVGRVHLVRGEGRDVSS